jgi:hypothetical protein
MEFSDFVQTRSGEIALFDRLKKACQGSDFYAIGNAGAGFLESARSSGHGLPVSDVQPT